MVTASTRPVQPGVKDASPHPLDRHANPCPPSLRPQLSTAGRNDRWQEVGLERKPRQHAHQARAVLDSDGALACRFLRKRQGVGFLRQIKSFAHTRRVDRDKASAVPDGHTVRVALRFAGEPPCTGTSTAPSTAARRNSSLCRRGSRHPRRRRCARTNRCRCPMRQCRAGHRQRQRHRRPARTWFRPKSTIRVHSENRFRCASRRPHLPQQLLPRSTRQILDRACRIPANLTT